VIVIVNAVFGTIVETILTVILLVDIILQVCPVIEQEAEAFWIFNWEGNTTLIKLPTINLLDIVNNIV